MSWFDTAGLASIAKTALKEAQKKIDKALDIQDDVISTSQTNKATLSSPLQSSTTPFASTNTWSSVTQSAWTENPKANEMITTPPKGGQSPISDTSKRQSIQSNSDSVELLSPPMSPGSGITSPSETDKISESVELLSTPASSDLISPDSTKSLDSVEVINNEEAIEDDEDSVSFNTVMDEDNSMNHSQRFTVLTNSGECVMDSKIDCPNFNDSYDSTKTLIEQNITPIKQFSSLDDGLLDSQTLLSDSTQSFEDVQIPDTGSVSDEKDMVKIGSGPSSDHNSTDEMETTTSSDIEIISNPNGDSGSSHSVCRSSPLKCSNVVGKKPLTSTLEFKLPKKKGHCRGPSEVSTQSDDSQSETDRLLRRVSELNEILEAREIRLIEIGRENARLQEKNLEYENLIDSKQSKVDNLETDEYTQRLSALEKKFQMTIRERDSLREELKAVRAELLNKIPKNDLTKIVADKDLMIDELRSEGEKLSKQVLQHSNIIKKLRIKEKDNESLLKKNKEQIEVLTDELERLKKSLTAKEEMERSQIEAVHKLCSEKRKLDKENHSLRSEVEDLTSKLDTVQQSFDMVKKQLQERQESHLELTKKADTLAALEKQTLNTQTQNTEIITQLEELREKLKQAESGMTLREQKLRQENAELLRRLEMSEIRAEELTQEVSLATIPFVRQLEAIQCTLTTRTNSWERQEKELLDKLESSQNKLQGLEHIETTANEKLLSQESTIKNLEDKLSVTLLNLEQAKASLQKFEFDFNLKDSEHKREIYELTEKIKESTLKITEYSEKIIELEKLVEKEKVREEQLEQKQFQSQISSVESNCSADLDTLIPQHNDERIGNTSPTPSLGWNSAEESLGSNAWNMDDLDSMSVSGRQAGSVYGLNMGFDGNYHSVTTFEHLQSTLKQKDGEICQLQWKLSRLNAKTNILNEEINKLTLELEKLHTMENDYSELKKQYDALLQLYGEKIEETQELELDLQDVKDLYKAQLDELIKAKENRKF